MSGIPPTTATPTATVARIPFKPTTPKFGGVEEVGQDTWAAWTGGKPKADWTGLLDPSPVSVTPTQYCSSSVSSQAKARAYRVHGLETKFSRNSDLQTFQKKVWKHLVEHGMDTITYLEDPIKSTEVASVVTDHARFDVKTRAIVRSM